MLFLTQRSTEDSLRNTEELLINTELLTIFEAQSLTPHPSPLTNTMDFSSALPTFIITLREGVEAALVIGIVFAYLKKAGQTHLKNWIYFGISAGIALSIIAGVAFEWVIKSLGAANEQYAGAIEPLMEAVFGMQQVNLNIALKKLMTNMDELFP